MQGSKHIEYAHLFLMRHLFTQEACLLFYPPALFCKLSSSFYAAFESGISGKFLTFPYYSLCSCPHRLPFAVLAIEK